MSTTRSLDAAVLAAATPRLSFARVVHSEWIKLRTLRSTVWSYLIVIVMAMGLAALMAGNQRSGAAQLSDVDQAGIVAQAAVVGLAFG